MYIEASKTKPGQFATLHYEFNKAVSKGCVYLYYHMYGVDIGSLDIIGKKVDTTPTTLWTKSENQGDIWSRATVPIAQETKLVSIRALLATGLICQS